MDNCLGDLPENSAIKKPLTSTQFNMKPHADLAQLGERKTEDLDVAGSIPAIRSHECT